MPIPPRAPEPRPPGLLYRLIRGLAVLSGLVALGLLSAYVAMELSMEPDRVEVTRVVGLESVAASELLKEAGLAPRVVAEDFHTRIPKGHVVSQRPPAGTRAKIGSEVRLIVSRGTDQIIVPDVAGQTLPQAQRTLSEAGLSTGRVSQIRSDAHPREQVIAQDPQPGAQVVRGTSIHLLQSLGPYEDSLAMPDLRGRELVSAVNLLKDLQIEATVVFQQAAAREGRVVAQDPPPGERVAVGARVRITVGE
ncbi:MAG: PASTA domain-containing protein [Candidatus Methylomirabilales bacterium]